MERTVNNKNEEKSTEEKTVTYMKNKTYQHMQTKNWKSKQKILKSNIANEQGPWQA